MGLIYTEFNGRGMSVICIFSKKCTLLHVQKLIQMFMCNNNTAVNTTVVLCVPLCSSVCVLVLYEYMCICMSKYVCRWGGQRITLSVPFHPSPP